MMPRSTLQPLVRPCKHLAIADLGPNVAVGRNDVEKSDGDDH